MKRGMKNGVAELSATLPELTMAQCDHIRSILQREGESGQSYYYGIFTTCGGYQVIRHYIVARYVRKGNECNYAMVEVFQNWIAPDGSQSVVARSCKSCMCRCYDMWDYGSEMKVRKVPTSPYTNAYRRYHITDMWFDPHVQYIPELRRNGFSVEYAKHCYSTDLFMSFLLSDNRLETLIKAGQKQLALESFDKPYVLDNYWPQIRIALRHSYIVTDVSLWKDTIDAIKNCGADAHNPMFVCPADLGAMHDMWVERLTRKRAKERKERERENISSYERAYVESHGKYLDIAIEQDGYRIRPLQSVQEFWEEGEAMHHCVYACGYYKKDNVLVLSVRDNTGRRVSTVELDLKDYTITQNRGFCNKAPEGMEEINNIIVAHRYLFEKAKRRRITNKQIAA